MEETAGRHLLIGTAGHIDHGKTALVEALTGTNTDRLPEERRRGVTIELGFAELAIGEHRFSIVDVPGHERFIRTMVAGATAQIIQQRPSIKPDQVKDLLMKGAKDLGLEPNLQGAGVLNMDCVLNDTKTKMNITRKLNIKRIFHRLSSNFRL